MYIGPTTPKVFTRRQRPIIPIGGKGRTVILMAKPSKPFTLESIGKEAGEWAFNNYAYKDLTLKEWADKIASGEYVTNEQFCNAVNDFFNEFKENGADEETLAKCIFIGLAFSNLEIRLFESRDGDTNE
jgi:hypothetical protein